MPRVHDPDSPLARARRGRTNAAPTAAATLQTTGDPHESGGSGGPVSARPGRSGSPIFLGPHFRGRGGLRSDERATLTELLTQKYAYVDHEWFALPEDEAYRKIFEEPEPLPLPDVSWYHLLMDPVRSNPQSLMRTPKGSVLLTAAQERVLFTQFNYCRREVVLRREALLSGRVEDRGRVERETLDWHARADALRTQVADTNLALVLAMAKRTRIYPGDFADLVSEGNMALLRSADQFDVGRGFKFSTYACRAILKAFARQGMKLSKHRQMFPMDYDPKLERSNYQAEKNASHEDDCADEVRRIVADNRADLSDVERTVVAARFNVGPGAQPTPVVDKPEKPVFRFDPQVFPEPQPGDYELPEPLRNRAADARPLTLEQVGKLIGVTKERVRQIQNKALEKIRLTLEEDYLA